MRVVVADLIGYLGRAQGGRPHQFSGALDACLGQIRLEGLPCFLAKDRAEMTGAVTHAARHILQRNVRIHIVVVNVILRLLNDARMQTIGLTIAEREWRVKSAAPVP